MKKLVVVLLGLFVLITVFQIAFIFNSPWHGFGPEDEGSSSSGLVSFTILAPNPEIYIHSPENRSYNFSYLPTNNYSILFNVSSNFGANLWRLEHEDLKHGAMIKENYGFAPEAPNLTIETVRWANRLTVFGENNDTGLQANASVVFYINVSNHAPSLGYFPNESYFCEGKFFTPMSFDAIDIDEDEVDLRIESSMGSLFAPEPSPIPEIHNGTLGTSGWSFVSNIIFLVPSLITKKQVGVHNLNLTAIDNGIPQYLDSRQVNLTFIEINELPVFGRIANRTIELDLDEANYTLYLELNVTDVEDGNASSGNLSFNTTFLEGESIFNVSRFGIINFTPNSSQQGFYSVEVCASDLGLNEARIHPNISLCGADAADVKTACQEFNLTITKDAIVIDSPPASGGGGGGGGGGGPTCQPLWKCDEWFNCQNTAKALASGDLVGEVYRNIQDDCSVHFWSDEICGYQTKNCVDVNNCSFAAAPNTIQSCYYTENPTCSDGIKNCHDGKCEFLIDCGGPCGQCATCSDGIQNQGEENTDCGGPCPNACPVEIPAGTAFLNYLFVIVISVVVIIAIIIFWRFRKRRKEL